MVARRECDARSRQAKECFNCIFPFTFRLTLTFSPLSSYAPVQRGSG